MQQGHFFRSTVRLGAMAPLEKKIYKWVFVFTGQVFFHDFLIAVAVMDALNKTSWLSLSIFFCGEAIIAE